MMMSSSAIAMSVSVSTGSDVRRGLVLDKAGYTRSASLSEVSRPGRVTPVVFAGWRVAAETFAMLVSERAVGPAHPRHVDGGSVSGTGERPRVVVGPRSSQESPATDLSVVRADMAPLNLPAGVADASILLSSHLSALSVTRRHLSVLSRHLPRACASTTTCGIASRAAT